MLFKELMACLDGGGEREAVGVKRRMPEVGCDMSAWYECSPQEHSCGALRARVRACATRKHVKSHLRIYQLL